MPHPKSQHVIPVAEALKVDAKLFFDTLLDDTDGIYFLEADEERDLGLTRGVDYRNRQAKGICLMLACTFANKSQYLQALGRVRRCTDQGDVYELMQQMWEQDY